MMPVHGTPLFPAQFQCRIAQSEQRFRLAQEAAGLGVWEWDIPADRVTWDEHCWSMLGFPACSKSMTYEQWSLLLHPDDLARVQHAVTEQLASGGQFLSEFRYRTAGQQWLWIQARGRVMSRDPAGRPLFMTGTHAEIEDQSTALELATNVNERFRKIAENVPGVLYQYQQWPDGRGAFPFATPGIEDIYGLAPEAVMNNAELVFERIHPQDLTWVRDSIARSMADLSPWLSEYRVCLQNGRCIWVEGHASPERQADGSTLWHGYIRDVTDRKELEYQLQTEHKRLENIIHGTDVGTWEWNVQTGETRFNERWAQIIGYRLEELQPVSIETWLRFAHPDDLVQSGIELERHFNGEIDTYDQEARMRHKDGHWVWVLDRGRIITWTEDGKPEWMAGTHLEITSRKNATEQLSTLAYFDTLTGLPRRALLADRLKQAITQASRRRTRFAVLFIDLDEFKPVNDGFGHEAGDAVLVAVAERMKTSLRAGDTLARKGGDEFVALLVDLKQDDDAIMMVERLLSLIHLPVPFEGRDLQVSASIGITYFPQGGEVSAEELVRQADMAMYKAKQSGKHRFAIWA